MSLILLTGSSGFVGLNLKKKFIKLGYEVIFPTRNELNLLSRSNTINYFKKKNPDFVVHLAGFSGGIEYMKLNPASIFDKNNLINSNLFNACLEGKVYKILLLNSINVYSSDVDLPFSEEDIFNGEPDESVSSYALTKKNVLYYSKFYNEQFGLNTLNLICDNIYGPLDNFDKKKSRVIPANIVRIHQAKKNLKTVINCWGSGESVRSFIHIDDVCNAIIYFLDSNFENEIINISNKKLISIKDLISKICLIMNYKGDLNWDISKPEGLSRRYMDLKKMVKYKFNPQIDIDFGLKQTIKWYENFG